MFLEVLTEALGMQAELGGYFCRSLSASFQSGYGISVFGSSGRVIFPNGRPVHGLAFLVRDAFPLTNQVLVPSLQVVVETSYRYAGLFGYFRADMGVVRYNCNASAYFVIVSGVGA